ncbi:hypothetical protein HYG86_15455 [Alkalicella caledoniensis]|uniref:Uncharacterized protein n=1 Tax=Alkalicella caledoniensis TaxID=2731377 RepID=A0A7G9WBK2_ALKCA|nr:hypothetical protein [Alkalicella caledoniensis]QNO16064.1 hypothetical protein HYG86_15455 [Alkalicella caledoniensis]
MGCCGGGHNHLNKNKNTENYNNKPDTVSNTNTMLWVGGMLVLIAIVSYIF